MVNFAALSSFGTAVLAAQVALGAPSKKRQDSAIGQEVAVSAPDGTPITNTAELASYVYFLCRIVPRAVIDWIILLLDKPLLRPQQVVQRSGRPLRRMKLRRRLSTTPPARVSHTRPLAKRTRRALHMRLLVQRTRRVLHMIPLASRTRRALHTRPQALHTRPQALRTKHQALHTRQLHRAKPTQPALHTKPRA